MTNARFFSLCAALAAAIVLTLAPMSEAARLGGGKSFGSRPSMSQPFKAPSTMQAPSQPASPAAPTLSQQPKAPTPTPAPAPQPKRFGWGSMLGGVLAGGLIGSLLFGGGLGGGFGGPGMLDMLLIGLAIFFAIKFFAARRNAQPTPAGASYSTGAQSADPAGWDTLRSTPASGPVPTPAAENPAVPAGFDTEDFLRGAKMAFSRLQASWDRRDLPDITQFTTADVQKEIKKQMEADPVPTRTELLLVNANLLGVTEENNTQTAIVFFDVLLREDPKQDAPTQVREVWHFTRPAGGTDTWKLDGIQQVE